MVVLSRIKKTDIFTRVVWGFMLFFLFIDVFFYRQRLYGDASFYLYQLVANEHFTFEHQRPISIVSQWIPLILVYAQAPMKWIMISYSFNEWLYWFGLFLILMYGLKDRAATVALILLMLISNKENWYNPVSELIQGSALLLVLTAYFRKESVKPRMEWWKFAICFLWLLLIIFSHPLQFLTVPALMLLFYLSFPALPFKRLFILGTMAFGIISYKYLNLDTYESDSSRWPPFDLSAIKLKPFLKYLISHYLGWFLTIFVISLYLIKRKQYLFLTTFLGILVGYLFFVFYKTGNLYLTNHEPFERYVFPTSVWIAWVFGHQIWEKGDKLKYFSPLVLFSVIMTADVFTLFSIRMPELIKRQSILDRTALYLQNFPEQKFVQRNQHFYVHDYGHDWVLMNEMALIAAQTGTKKSFQLVLEQTNDPNNLKKINEDPEAYLYAGWWVKKFHTFNPHYFYFQPGKVRYLNTDGVQSHMPDSFFKKLTIIAEQGMLPFIRNRYGDIRIVITNPHSVPIYSGQKYEKPYISYHWEGPENVWDGERTLLAADVIGSMPQDLRVKAPSKPGKYTLVIDLMYENKRWCGINSRLPVKVW